MIARLPKNLTVKPVGAVPHHEVIEVLEAHDFFILPTLSENFGHVCLEALAAGTPLLVSDRTPWRNLDAKGIGWDISLDSQDLWRSAILECLAMDEKTYSSYATRARAFAAGYLADKSLEGPTEELFRNALSDRR
jgi:glycosyltransferase involved in cell wall biosynthesis